MQKKQLKKIGGENIGEKYEEKLGLGCADDRMLEDHNIKERRRLFQQQRIKRISLLGASGPIAEFVRDGRDLSFISSQFREAEDLGIDYIGVVHHIGCRWYGGKICTGVANCPDLTPQDIVPFYDLIEMAIQFPDMLQSREWILANRFFKECSLGFAYKENDVNFSFEEKSPSDLSQEIKSLRKELSVEFTPEQLACIGVI